MSLRSDDTHKGELYIDLVIGGNYVETLADFVIGLLDLDVMKSGMGDDVYYQYSDDLKVTFVKFKGRAWLYVVADLVKKIKLKSSVIGWSSWTIPLLVKDIVPVTGELPHVGDFVSLATYIDERADVHAEDADEVAGAMREELGELDIKDINLDIDDAHS